MTLDELIRRATHLTVGEVTRDIEVGTLRVVETRTILGVSGSQRGQHFTYLEQPRRRDEFPGERIGTTELLFLVAMPESAIPRSLVNTLRRYGMDGTLVCRQADPQLARWRVETRTKPWRIFPPERVGGLPSARTGSLGLPMDPLVATLQRNMVASRSLRGR